jgi:hypothetical protein
MLIAAFQSRLKQIRHDDNGVFFDSKTFYPFSPQLEQLALV